MKQAISAGHEITLEVAKEILLAGGNAFDAAIAAHLAMFITEPCMASAGGGGIAMILNDGKISMLDFFTQTPLNKKTKAIEYFPITVDFGSEKEIFNIGIASAAVPGTMAGIFHLVEHYASIPLKELVQPAKKLAIEGLALNTFQAYDIELLFPIFKQDPSVKHIFFKNDQIKKEGDLIQMPELANFLDFMVDEGSRGFYHGEIASSIVRDTQERGGNLIRKDFEDYCVYEKKPFKISTHQGNIYLPNGPSLGAGLLASSLGFVAEGVSIANAITNTQTQIKDLRKLPEFINQFYPAHNYSLQDSAFATKGTSHFNILDKNQNGISLTSTIGEGCGYFIPNTAMQLNNMLGETFLLPDGAHSWKANTRLNSMMTPLIRTSENSNDIFITGSGGASRIPFSILQVLVNIFNHNMNLEEATTASRYHFQDQCLHIEGGAPIVSSSYEIKQWDDVSLFFGGVHSIRKNSSVFEAVGDARRYGVAEVF